MRRVLLLPLAVILALAVVVSDAAPVRAQSFLQSFFGNIFTKPAPPSGAPVRSEPRPMTSFRHQGPYGSFGQSRQAQPQYKTQGGYYRTLCVRTCDGYYFPISSATGRSRFRKDAKACRARCGGKLYYLPRHSSDMAQMKDLSGRRYEDLDTAFLYREKLINGCTCRPMPWSAAERARHRRYAYEAEISRINAERLERLAEEARKRREGVLSADDAMAAVDPPVAKATVLAAIDATTTDTGKVEPAKAQSNADPDSESTNEPGTVSTHALSQAQVDEGPMVEKNVRSTKPRATVKKRRKTTRRVKKPASVAGWPFGGNSGSSQYSWPGDR